MSSETPQAILIDLDDTILAYDAVAEPVWQEICRLFAPRVIGLEADRLYETLRAVRSWFSSDPERQRQLRMDLVWGRRQVVSLAFARLGIDAPELANEMADTYTAERETAAYPISGAIDMLERVRRRSLPLCLVTNGTGAVQRQKLERFGLYRFFDLVIIEEEFGVGKPDERVFLQALGKLGVLASEAMMVGDDLERDIGGAQNVGISGIWVDWRGGGLPPSSKILPERIIKSIAELIH